MFFDYTVLEMQNEMENEKGLLKSEWHLVFFF